MATADNNKKLSTQDIREGVKEEVLTRTDYLVFGLLTSLSLGVIIYFLGYWFSFRDWLAYPISFSFLTLILFAKVANSQVRWYTLLLMKRPRPVRPPAELKVAAVTTIVPGAESLEMLEQTLAAMVRMDYPHDTWVLDEGDDEQVKALCRKLGAHHFSRKNLPYYLTDDGVFQAHSKHGNYNAWLDAIGYTRYEIINAFDPDHVPAPSFLTQVLGYFADSRVGYVQAAQAYYNQSVSFIARGAAEETYEYYSCSQMTAYNFDQPAVVGGHNTHRVKALKQVGGFAAHDADDLLIGLRYQAHQWRGVYVPQILARGITPVDWDGYLKQQLRWARSVIDVKCRLRQLVDKRISLIGHMLSALHGIFYLQNSITTFLGLLLLVTMLATGAVPQVISLHTLPRLALLCAVLQGCAFYRQKFYLNPRQEGGTHWRAGLLRYAKWPIFLLALWQFAARQQIPYALTRKVQSPSRARLLFIPHLLVIVTVCAAGAFGLLSGQQVPTLLYWLATAVATASLALILTSRRQFPPPYDKELLASFQNDQQYDNNTITPLNASRPYGSE